MFTQDEEYLVSMIFYMIQEIGAVELLKLPETQIVNFLDCVRLSYRDVPFHSFFHAFNVTQTAFYFLSQSEVSEGFTTLEKLSMLVATLCHDIDHPGLSNSFLINAGSRLAMQYNDISVLENHHCNITFHLLSLPQTNFLGHLEPHLRREFRLNVITCIIATDLTIHGQILEQFRSSKDEISLHSTAGEDRRLIMKCLVKCADLSNEIRETSISRKWAELVQKEFFLQGDLEAEKRLPLTPWMRRGQVSLPQEQINFISRLCLPLYQEVSDVIPGLKTCIENMIEHVESYKKEQLFQKIHKAVRVAAFMGTHTEQNNKTNVEATTVEQDQADRQMSPAEVVHSERKNSLSDEVKHSSTPHGGSQFDTLTLHELQRKLLPKDVDITRLEHYLSKQEFEQTFHMTKEEFYKLPKWKQVEKKKSKKMW